MQARAFTLGGLFKMSGLESPMARPLVWVPASIVFALELVLWATGAWAKDGGAKGAGQPSLRDMPAKDCTRVNGRYGYYGNPWCNRLEQLRWDRWEARRRARSGND
jgi:hypothetical protein